MTQEKDLIKSDGKEQKPLFIVMLSILMIVFSVFLAVPSFLPYSAAVIILSLLFVLLKMRSGSFFAFVLFSYIMLFALTGTLVVPALLASLFLSSCIGAYLIISSRSVWLAAIPIISFTLAFALTSSFYSALSVLVCLPASAVLAFAVLKNRTRLFAVCGFSAVFGICSLLLVAAFMYASEGKLDFTAVWDTVEQYRQTLVEYFSEFELAVGEETIKPFSEDLAKIIVGAVLNIIPSIIITGFNAIAFISNLSLLKLLSADNNSDLLTEETASFRMSAVSAILFIATYIIIMFTGDVSSLFIAVCNNINIVLSFGLFVAGCGSIYSKFVTHPEKRKSFIIAAVIIFVTFASLAFTLVTLVGAYTTLSYRKKSSKQ